MKLHHFDTVLTFGQHKGETINEVLDKNPNYMIWCYSEVDHFYVTDAVWEIVENNTGLFTMLIENSSISKEIKEQINKNKKFHEKKRNYYKAQKLKIYQEELEAKLIGKCYGIKKKRTNLKK